MQNQLPDRITIPYEISNLASQGREGAEIAIQLRALVQAQRDLRTALRQMSENNPAREEVAEQLEVVSSQLSELTARAVALSQPGAHYTETAPAWEFPRMPDEYFALGIVFILSTFLPLSVALAMRVFRRGNQQRTAMTPELADRINRIEGVVETTAIEVERIGEGQRFVTQMLADHMAALRDATRAPLPEQNVNRAVQRQITPH